MILISFFRQKMKVFFQKIFFLLNVFFIFIFPIPSYSEILNKALSENQMLPAGHWIYGDVMRLERECGFTSLLDSAPLSVYEISLAFQRIEKEKLSQASQGLYDKIQEYLTVKDLFPSVFKPVDIGMNVILHPELMYKSNKKIDWSFSTDYTSRKSYNYESDEWQDSDYGAASNYSGNKMTQPFLSLPVCIGFPGIAFFEGDFFIAKNFWAMSDNSNFTNVLYSDDIDFLWPTYAYASTGHIFQNEIGLQFHVGKEGRQIGRSHTGSVILNSSFQTDFYSNLSLYSKNFGYSMDVMEVSNSSFLYLHSLEVRPFKWFRIGSTEGVLINSPFEIRYLNPLMIFHSFGSWTEYADEEEYKYLREAHTCAYLGLDFEIVPFKNFRIYGLFSQTEIQPPNELGGNYGRSLPDGFGFQFGTEYTLFTGGNGNDSFLEFYTEGFFLSPFLYIKQSGDWSLCRKRYNMIGKGDTPIYTWIGSPIGPDSAGFETGLSFTKRGKFESHFSYLFVAHGSNSFGMLENTYELIDDEGNSKGTWPAFYPSVLVKLGLIDQTEAEKIARSISLTSPVRYTSRFALEGSYTVNERLQFDSGFSFTLVNQNDEILSGLEMYLACDIRLFDF